MRKTVHASFQRLHSCLLALGYRSDRLKNYRKGKFHVIVNPKNGRVEIHIHVDLEEPWTPSFSHHSRRVGKDINEEFRNIMKEVKKRV